MAQHGKGFWPEAQGGDSAGCTAPDLLVNTVKPEGGEDDLSLFHVFRASHRNYTEITPFFYDFAPPGVYALPHLTTQEERHDATQDHRRSVGR